MATNLLKRQAPKPKRSAIRWLLDSDPSIRWQVKRELTGESEEVVAVEQSRVAVESWGARLLSLFEDQPQTVMEVPTELVATVRELVARHRAEKEIGV
jgi:hypothetical protein